MLFRRGIILAGIVLFSFSSRLWAIDQEKLQERQQPRSIRVSFKSLSEKSKIDSAMKAYEEAVGYFEGREYRKAQKALQFSISQFPQNPFAYELLGDIAYYQQKMTQAREYYDRAYQIEPHPDLKAKRDKVSSETDREQDFSSYRLSHFIIRYHDEEKKMESFELREILKEAYQSISKEFIYHFKEPVVVVLYDPEEFRKNIAGQHWVGGLFDGKVRMPVIRGEFTDPHLQALTAHELTHVFVAELSSRKAPPWLNEGLAEYQENKFQKVDLTQFQKALDLNKLFSVHELVSVVDLNAVTDIERIRLFYEQSYLFVQFLVDQYRMFRVKKLLKEFGEGKGVDEAVREGLRSTLASVEKEWLKHLE